MSDALEVLAYLRSLTIFGERLSAQSFAIYEHHHRYFAFGSWYAVVGTRDRRVKISYDGRDFVFDIAVADFQNGQSEPSWQWLPSVAMPEPRTHSNIFAAAELVVQRALTSG